jgi:ArsR family transcriptional regulator
VFLLYRQVSISGSEGFTMATGPRKSRKLPLLQGPECCPSGLSEPLNRAAAEALAQLLKAVADPARLQLLALLRCSDQGQACVCDLIGPLGLSQPTVSHHLKVLTDAGLISREQRGIWAWFTLVPARIAELAAVFDAQQ